MTRVLLTLDGGNFSTLWKCISPGAPRAGCRVSGLRESVCARSAHAVCVCAFLFRPGQVLSNRQNHRTDNVHDLLFSA
jgi:hypothetical protein